MSLTPEILAAHDEAVRARRAAATPQKGIKRTALTLAIGAALGAGLTYGICQPNRYHVSQQNGRAIRIDRWTGQTWQLSANTWLNIYDDSRHR